MRWNRSAFCSLIALGGAAMLATTASATRVQLVSTMSNGDQGDRQSREPSISADGRFVAFESLAQLVPEDTNSYWDIYVKDMETGEIKLCSQSTDGEVGNAFSTMSIISADASIVCYMSTATNLVPNDTNDQWDYFVHDLTTRETTRVSVNSDEEQANGGADCNCRVYKFPGVSAQGRYIAFQSNASNLVEGDNNDRFDIFLRDRELGTTVRVTESWDGGDTDNDSWLRDMSPNGRYIVFHSSATNHVQNDTNDQRDIFLRDMVTGTTELISLRTDGGQTNDISDSPRVSAGGRYVAFASLATNLIDNDTNDDWDVFLRDRQNQTTVRISEGTGGVEGNGYSRHPSISRDGRWVTFHGLSTNWVAGDMNGWRDTFLHDRLTGNTMYLSGGPDGIGDDISLDAFISGDGKWVVYDTLAENLADGDGNGKRDVVRLERFGEHLEILGPQPGLVGRVNYWAVDGLLPGEIVRLEYDFQQGDIPAPNCDAIDLNIPNPKLVKTGVANANGRAIIKAFVPAKAAGLNIHFQAWSESSCAKSPVVISTFD